MPPLNMPAILEVNNLSKSFFSPLSFREILLFRQKPRKRVNALCNISFALEKGGMMGLLGPNGSGKTTLLKILCTLITPDAGKARICGYDVTDEAEFIKPKIGLVSEDERGFYWRLSFRQNLEFYGALYGMGQSQISQKIRRLAGILDIPDWDRPYQYYSLGMRRRLGLARCLLYEPEIILLDEPTKDLDPQISRNFRLFLKDILVGQLKKTVLFTTHQTEEADFLSDTIGIIKDGKLKALGTKEALKNKFGLASQASVEELFLKVAADEE